MHKIESREFLTGKYLSKTASQKRKAEAAWQK